MCMNPVSAGCEDECVVELGGLQGARHRVVAARQAAAAAQAQLAAACVEYVDIRMGADRHRVAVGLGPARVQPGEFVADEVSVLLREQPYPVRYGTVPVPPTRRSDHDPGGYLPVPHLHRASRPLRS
jgi:hypothetical protein